MRGRLVDETLFDEVRVAQKVTHANVCRIYDLVAIDNYHFIKMEFVAGETLSTRLGRDGPLPIADAIRIARDVARGLVAAHAKGIVHRDLKPSNVMLAVDRAVLMDFGLARSLSHAVEDGSGTPGYMAPEQITTGKSDERADLYALGCVVYQMLTGKLVFEASTPVDVVAKHVTTTPPDVRVARADTPRARVKALRCTGR